MFALHCAACLPPLKHQSSRVCGNNSKIRLENEKRKDNMIKGSQTKPSNISCILGVVNEHGFCRTRGVDQFCFVCSKVIWLLNWLVLFISWK